MVAERPLLKLTSVLGRMSAASGSLPIYQTRGGGGGGGGGEGGGGGRGGGRGGGEGEGGGREGGGDLRG